MDIKYATTKELLREVMRRGPMGSGAPKIGSTDILLNFSINLQSGTAYVVIPQETYVSIVTGPSERR